ncbi:virulence-associated E family protein [gut metagenome]|uniref:Virulence-associated E family protein n=1 Tax=gut metagenome TaxID=749906 RepID=J9FRL1_9ZZZZ
MAMNNTSIYNQEKFIRAFCQVYSCSKAIEEFLSDSFSVTQRSGIYQSKTNPTIQLRVDEDSQSVYCSGIPTPYNAFHIVRLYLYGHLDMKVDSNISLNQQPSFQAMIKICRNNAAIRAAFVKLQNQKTSSSYANWEAALSINPKTNSIASTGKNLKLILLNDSKLNQVRYNRFTKKDETDCPEFSNERGNLIDDESIGKMALYIEETYGLYIPQLRILEMLKTTATERSFHPIKDFILSEVWDGIERIDTLIIRYLKGEDSMLTRAQTRKWMIAAVARIFEPGCKFDHVLTLAGPEGAGKSTFFKVLANGEWFSDSFSFKHDDKAKVEEITGHWIVELSELSGMDSKQDPQLIKAFLSREKDEIRPAYARKCETIPRSNVFAGSTNQSNFLQNCNGNRRWWIIPIKGDEGPGNWQEALKREVPQLWAEAYHYYQSGEPIFLSKELEMDARRLQEQFTENQADELLDDIEAFLERPVPTAYDQWPISVRLQWQLWKTGRIDWLRDEYRKEGTHLLTMVSARMIKEELPNELIRTSHRYHSNYINALMAKFSNWKRSEQEKVSGLPLFYCGADGRAKYPWLRCPASTMIEKPKDAPLSLLSLPFMENLNQEGKEG